LTRLSGVLCETNYVSIPVWLCHGDNNCGIRSIPTQLEGLGSIEAHHRSFILRVRVSHHSRLIAIFYGIKQSIEVKHTRNICYTIMKSPYLLFLHWSEPNPNCVQSHAYFQMDNYTKHYCILTNTSSHRRRQSNHQMYRVASTTWCG